MGLKSRSKSHQVFSFNGVLGDWELSQTFERRNLLPLSDWNAILCPATAFIPNLLKILPTESVCTLSSIYASDKNTAISLNNCDLKFEFCGPSYLRPSVNTFLIITYVFYILYFLRLFWLYNYTPNRPMHIRHQCRETTVFSCHRCLINTGAEKMNNI